MIADDDNPRGNAFGALAASRWISQPESDNGCR
jgi:hypothetical protein